MAAKKNPTRQNPVRYRDRKTGRFVSRSTWKRSHAHDGVRFVREIRPRVKRKPPTSRKPKKPARRPRPVLPHKPKNVEWLVTISYHRKRRRSFEADLLIIAPLDATPGDLAEIAREHLPAKYTFLANWIEGGYSDIAMGKPTNQPISVRVRSFRRLN